VLCKTGKTQSYNRYNDIVYSILRLFFWVLVIFGVLLGTLKILFLEFQVNYLYLPLLHLILPVWGFFDFDFESLLLGCHCQG
jgi:hypothetical protein